MGRANARYHQWLERTSAQMAPGTMSNRSAKKTKNAAANPRETRVGNDNTFRWMPGAPLELGCKGGIGMRNSSLAEVGGLNAALWVA